MAPIQIGRLSVEIAVNSIDGFIHTLIEVPVKRGFWVSFTVKDDRGKSESFPLVDADYRLVVFGSYPEALQEAASRLMNAPSQN